MSASPDAMWGVLQDTINIANSKNDAVQNAWSFLNGVTVPLMHPTQLRNCTDWVQKDKTLASTITHVPAFYNAVKIGSTKFASQDFEVEGERADLAARLRDVLLISDLGKGWTHFAKNMAMQFLLQGNSWCARLIRASNAIGSPIINIQLLKKGEFKRTDDELRPVEVEGKKLWRWEVLIGEDLRGNDHSTDVCAAEGVYSTIYTICAINTRIMEIETGSGFSGVDFINTGIKSAIDATFVEGAAENATEKLKAAGIIYQKGRLVIPVQNEDAITGYSLDLIDRPPHEHVESQRLAADLIFANAIGVYPAEINPKLTGKVALDSGRTASDQMDLSKTRGIEMLVKDLIHQIGIWVTPQDLTFRLYAPNTAEKIRREQLRKLRIENASALVSELGLPAEQGRNILADTNDLPREFAEPDETKGGTATDTGEGVEEGIEPNDD